MRLDLFLKQKFGLRSRTYSENLILRGMVTVGGKVVKKPSFDVAESLGESVEILRDEEYASQGE